MLALATACGIRARRVRRLEGILVLALLAAAPALAAVPPTLVNYQGVLRDNNDKPLSGTYDMLFRFMDAATAGNEIMTDQHAGVTSNAVAVSGGLFNVALGSGTITDGTGPGTYTSLDAVFRDYGAAWLEVKVGAETLSPRSQLQSAAYALNATYLSGQPASNFIDLSTTQQTKNGSLSAYVSGDSFGTAIAGWDKGSYGTGVFGRGDNIGVYGYSIDGTALYGYSYNNGTAVRAETTNGTAVSASSTNGTVFYGISNNGDGLLVYGAGHGGTLVAQAVGGIGVEAHGATGGVGGRFSTLDGAAHADVASAANSTGVSGSAASYGGSFSAYGPTGVGITASATSYGGSFTAYGPTGVGISADGASGGKFSSHSTPGVSVVLAESNRGVNASGGSTSGYFQTSVPGSTGVYGEGSSTGVSGLGNAYGGSFTGNGAASIGVYGSSSGTGVQGRGGSGGGGYFDNANSGNARLAYGDSGIVASGNSQGGEFRQGIASGAYALLAYNRTGVAGYARNPGENPGFFQDLSSSSYASIGQAGYKIVGSGAVSFVQNDPENLSNVIVYAAPEGDEVAVYTRGSARLVNGEARVPLGPTFRKVANPDLGLTANVTPVGDAIPLAVTEKSTTELVVRGPSGSNTEFDYVIWGLRIGFEDRAVVQPKERESFIPSRDIDNAIYQRQPELRTYSARQRFLAALAQRNPGAATAAMEKSLALEQAIGVYDRARDESRIAPADPNRSVVVEKSAEEIARLWKATTTAAPPAPAAAPTPAPAVQLGVSIARVADTVQPGDVVAADPSGSDSLRLGATTSDPLLAGIVVAPVPSMHLEPGEALVALAGSIVPCRVDATLGAIHAGDLLTSSPTPGCAMRATDAAPGTILGKALENFNGGTGAIRVLVMSR